MHILVIADLHMDTWQRTSVDPLASIAVVLPTLDALIIAGDLSNDALRRWPGFLAHIARFIDASKVYVFPGNHDYYFGKLGDDNRLAEVVKMAGMHFAQKTSLDFGGVRFLCCTLWTDFMLTGDCAAAMDVAQSRMNDYTMIKAQDGWGHARPFDTQAIHQGHLRWLTDEISKPFAGKTIVVTHHGPSPRATGPIDTLTAAFSSDLDAWILHHKPDAWLFGHTHRQLSGRVGRTDIINVSLGYPDEERAQSVSDTLLRGRIDTEKPELLMDLQQD